MDLKQALLDYAVDNIEGLARDYQRSFTLDMLDVKISLRGGNWMEKNISLRRALHRQWKLAPAQRQHLVAWYVREWGGIKTNSLDTLTRYGSIAPQRLITRRDVGIASWSKALSIVDPANFAIYNARIAAALHGIQLLKNVKNPVYFPDLNSRHTAIRPIVQASRKSIKRIWPPVHKPTFYENYNILLKDVALEIGNGIVPHTIEMMLSSHALVLAEQWMDSEHSQDHCA